MFRPKSFRGERPADAAASEMFLRLSEGSGEGVEEHRTPRSTRLAALALALLVMVAGPLALSQLAFARSGHRHHRGHGAAGTVFARRADDGRGDHGDDHHGDDHDQNAAVNTNNTRNAAGTNNTNNTQNAAANTRHSHNRAGTANTRNSQNARNTNHSHHRAGTANTRQTGHH